MESRMFAERAAFSYALLRTHTALYPRMVFRTRFPLTDDDFGPSTVDRLNRQIEAYDQQARSECGQRRAFLQLLVADARSAVGYLKEHSEQLQAFDVEAIIGEYTDVAEKYLQRELGLDWHRQRSVVVEHYPAPFEDADWFAVAGASGMPTASVAGIHFLRRHMQPIVTALATLHENVHHGTRGPGGYHRYFDEGIANFLAYTIYLDHTGDLEGVRLFHTFLDELNVLYAYPPMLRLLGSMVQQAGLVGLYRLIRWRANAPDQVDWTGVLRDTRAGTLDVPPWPVNAAHERVPDALERLTAAAMKVIALITFPEKALASPVAYLVFGALAAGEPRSFEQIRQEWQLSEQELAAVVRELEDHFVWNVSDGQLSLFGHSDFMAGTVILRARVPA